MTTAQKTGVILLGALDAGLKAGALWDLRRRDKVEVRGPKWGWTIIASTINLAGPIAYFIFGRKR